MKISIRQLVISLVAFLLAVSVLIGFVRNPEIVGGQVLVVRALILNFSIFAALVAVFPLYPLFYGRPGTYGLVVCLPALLPVFVYFLVLLPQQSSGGVSGEQLSSELITDALSSRRRSSPKDLAAHRRHPTVEIAHKLDLSNQHREHVSWSVE